MTIVFSFEKRLRQQQQVTKRRAYIHFPFCPTLIHILFAHSHILFAKEELSITYLFSTAAALFRPPISHDSHDATAQNAKRQSQTAQFFFFRSKKETKDFFLFLKDDCHFSSSTDVIVQCNLLYYVQQSTFIYIFGEMEISPDVPITTQQCALL